MSIDAAIGARLRQRRLEQGKTLTDLAAELGVSYQQVQKYEKGDDRISAANLMLLANMLGASAVDLLPGAELQASQSSAAHATAIEIAKLVRGFERIADENVRTALIELARTLGSRSAK